MMTRLHATSSLVWKGMVPLPNTEPRPMTRQMRLRASSAMNRAKDLLSDASL